MYNGIGFRYRIEFRYAPEYSGTDFLYFDLMGRKWVGNNGIEE
jgi:hypothetical protein